EDEVLIWFDDDCERRRLIYIDEIQPGTSLPKWRRRTFINTLSSVKQPSVGCKEIYKSKFGAQKPSANHFCGILS
ncbi:hypothetical protein, partial [Eubacterium sp. An11]|uniref:hypothetical protein n=1 Tax=Eubacterium sp. An11 TaxID=1965542 RepID=UPI00194FDA13